MTIAFGAQGTTPSGTTASITGTTSVTPAAPASMATGDYIVIAVWNRPGTVIPLAPVGWRLIRTFSGGGGTEGLDAGPIRVTLLGRKKTAAWSAMPAITITGGTSAMAQAFRYTNSTSYWDIASTTAEDTTAATTWSGTGAADPGLTAGDMVLVFAGATSDTPTWSAQAVTATGVSAWGTVAERSEPKTTQGNDIGGYVSQHPVNTGTSSAAPVASATASTGTGATGSMIILRLREIALDDIVGYSEAAGNTATLTISWDDLAPLGVQAGDEAYLFWVYSTTATITADPSAAGFDQTGLPGGGVVTDGGVNYALWKRTCTGSESGTFNVTMSGATRHGISATLIRGWDHHLATSGGDTGSDASHTAPAATPTVSGAAVLIGQGERAGTGSTTTTPPAGYTTIGDVALVATNGILNAIAYEGSAGTLTGGHASGVAVSPGAWVNDTAQTDVGMWTVLLAPPTTNINRDVSDTAPASEALARALVLARTPSDTAPATDAAGRASGVPRDVSDSAPATDATARALVTSRSLSDSAPATDSLAREQAAQSRTLNDSAPATDSTARGVGKFTTATDSAPATDTTAGDVVRQRLLSDAAGGTDALARDLTQTRTDSDDGGGTDALGRAGAYTRVPSDSAPATDTLGHGGVGQGRFASDSAPATDALTRDLTQARSLSDAAPAPDTLARSLTQARALTDAAPAVDTSENAVTHNIDRAVSDSAPATDTSDRGQAATRATTDAAGGGDSLERLAGLSAALSDAAGGDDTLGLALLLERFLTDSAPADDTTVASVEERSTIETGDAWAGPVVTEGVHTGPALGGDATAGPSLALAVAGQTVTGPVI